MNMSCFNVLSIHLPILFLFLFLSALPESGPSPECTCDDERKQLHLQVGRCVQHQEVQGGQHHLEHLVGSTDSLSNPSGPPPTLKPINPQPHEGSIHHSPSPKPPKTTKTLEKILPG